MFFFFITFAFSYKLLYWIDIIGKILYQSNQSIKLIIPNLAWVCCEYQEKIFYISKYANILVMCIGLSPTRSVHVSISVIQSKLAILVIIHTKASHTIIFMLSMFNTNRNISKSVGYSYKMLMKEFHLKVYLLVGLTMRTILCASSFSLRLSRDCTNIFL